MAGNLLEWTRSECKPYPYNPADGRENLESDVPCVLRGGSWAMDRSAARASSRGSFEINRDFRSFTVYGLNLVGFRIVVRPLFKSKDKN
jgi:formylglycine-generating enzyme required for sulfatase activity